MASVSYLASLESDLKKEPPVLLGPPRREPHQHPWEGGRGQPHCKADSPNLEVGVPGHCPPPREGSPAYTWPCFLPRPVSVPCALSVTPWPKYRSGAVFSAQTAHSDTHLKGTS